MECLFCLVWSTNVTHCNALNQGSVFSALYCKLKVLTLFTISIRNQRKNFQKSNINLNALDLATRLKADRQHFYCIAILSRFFYDAYVFISCGSGVDFINVLCTTFTLAEPKSVKWQCWLDCIFCAFGIYVCKSCM